MRNVHRGPNQFQPLLDKLEEIRAELERLRKAIEERDSGGDRVGFRSR